MTTQASGRIVDPRPFLLALAHRPYEWRTMNCALAVADYWLWATGRNADPAAEWRDRFDTADEFHAELRRKGGLPAVVARACRDLGLVRIRDGNYPSGCVAVVRLFLKNQPVRHHLAIRTPSGRWAMKCSDGVVFSNDVKVVAAWVIP